MEMYFAGLDLGQVRDYSALAVVQWTELKGAWDHMLCAHRKRRALWLRHLGRMPLGTPYPEIVRRVREVTRSAELRGRSYLAADATGVGMPVIDLLRRADLECVRIFPVLITGGEREQTSGSLYRVPKRDLIVRLEALLAGGALRIAEGLREGSELVEELAGMQVKVTGAGREQFGEWRAGRHDDLVLALALACWGAKTVAPDPLEEKPGWWRREDQLAWERSFAAAMRR